MGYYVGPAPEPDAFDRLHDALDDLKFTIVEQLLAGMQQSVEIVAQHAPRRISPPPEKPRKISTGPTQRLVCRACGDVPPTGAAFCINCGAPL